MVLVCTVKRHSGGAMFACSDHDQLCKIQLRHVLMLEEPSC